MVVDLLRDGWFEGAVLLKYPCRGAWRRLAAIGTGKRSRLMFDWSCERPCRSAEMGMIRDVAQFGSALGSGPRGRWFESSRPDQKTQVRGLRPLAFFLFWPQEGHRWPQDLLPNCADDTNFESQFMSCAPALEVAVGALGRACPWAGCVRLQWLAWQMNSVRTL